MSKVIESALAREDLVDIWIYSLELWGPEQADNYLDGLNSAIRLLAANPQIGESCEYIGEGYRKWVVARHVIFYKLEGESLLIIRILSNKMDVERKLTPNQ